jgi:hypothetical protein
MYVDGGFDSSCPDCLAEIYGLQAKYPGSSDKYSGCGLSIEGHRRLAQVRKQAEEDAARIVLEERERAEYARIFQKAVHDEIDRQARGATG